MRASVRTRALLGAAEVAEHGLFGHADQTEAAVGAHVAAADPDVGAVGTDDLDDRADVADLAIVAVVVFDRLHLLRHHLSNLALVESHPVIPSWRYGRLALLPSRGHHLLAGVEVDRILAVGVEV